MNNKRLILNEFWLKIVAIITMTFDHLGIFLCDYADTKLMFEIGDAFRYIGRLAFPLFVFMLVEGIFHTKNVKVYLFRIGIIGAIITLGEYLGSLIFGLKFLLEIQSPFTDLFLIGLGLALLKRNDKFSYFSILPFGYCAFSYIYIVLTKARLITFEYPLFLFPSYNFFGVILGVGYYFVQYVNQKEYFKVNPDNNIKDFNSDLGCRTKMNFESFFIIFIAVILLWLTAKIQVNGRYAMDTLNYSCQGYCLIAGLFILTYNGKRGYNAPWFKYGTYIYFPLHLVLIFLTFLLIYGY